MDLIYCGNFEVMKGSRTNEAVHEGKTVRVAFDADSLCLICGRAAARWWIEDANGLHVRTSTRVFVSSPDLENDDGFVIYLPDQEVISGEEREFFDGYWLRPINAIGRYVTLHGEEDLKKRCKTQA